MIRSGRRILRTCLHFRTAFGNLENDAPVETYMINGETRRKIREYVDAHGFGDNREAGALQEMYDRYLVPNCVR